MPSEVGTSSDAKSGSGDLTPELINTSVWTDEAVADAGIPIYDSPFVTVGGGLGSFAMIDTLRISGMPAEQIRVLSGTRLPYETYRYLTRNSQIPPHERIRSDSSSVIDNIWGYPSYAFREVFRERTLRPLWTVGTEPILSDYFTPKVGQVFESLDREMARIRWDSMLSVGQVRMVRKRGGGGYITILTPPEGTTPTRRVAFRSRFVHVGVGYPAIRLLDDLQEYRERNRDFSRVVNAYEPHDHVYDEMLRRPGTVLVRGSGIVSSRVLQRLLDDRERLGAQTTVVHLFRNYVGGPQGSSPFLRRPGSMGYAYQGFNYAKSAWGGQDKVKFERLKGQQKLDFLHAIGGTNTAPRRSWMRQLERGLAGGWYQQRVGEVVDVVPGPAQGAARTIVTRVRGRDGSEFEIGADFIIDATGLVADVREHRLLADLLDHSGARIDVAGRLEVDLSFALVGTDSPPGRMYACGSATTGSVYAGTDSFLGLQYAALSAADDLARQGFTNKIGFGRSISEWWKWFLNKTI